MATRRYEQRARAEEAEKTRQRIIDAVARAPARGAVRAGLDRADRRDGRRRPLDRVRDLRLARRALRRRRPSSCTSARATSGSSRRPTTPTPARRCGAASAPRARCWRPTATSAARCTRWRSSTRRRSAARSSAGGGARGGDGADRRAAPRAGPPPPGVSVEEANDVLWVITSFESFDLLYTGRGLPLDTVVERLTETAERALMTPCGGRPARRCPCSRARTGWR